MTEKFDKLTKTLTEDTSLDLVAMKTIRDLKKLLPRKKWGTEHCPKVEDPKVKRLKKDKKQGRKPVTNW